MGILDAIANPTVMSPNLLQTYGQGQQVAATQNQNLLFRARAAAGRAYQQATDPATGQVNVPQATALIAADPTAALAAQDNATSGQALQQAQQTRAAGSQQLVNQTVASLMALPDGAMNQATFRDRIGGLVQSGAITPTDASAAEADLPPDTDGSGQPNAAAFRLYGLRHLIGNLAGPQQGAAIYGGIDTVNDGKHTNFVQTPSPMAATMGATPQVIGQVNQLTTPEFDAQPTKVGTDDQGRDIMNTNLGFRQMLAGIGATPQSPLGTGRLPSSLLNPNKPGAAPASGAPPAYVDPTETPPPDTAPAAQPAAAPAQPAAPAGIAIGMPINAKISKEASGAALAKDQEQAGNFQATSAPITHALGALAGADTGRASAILQGVRANYQDIAPSFLQRLLPSDGSRRDDYDLANKYLTQLQLQTPGGSRSDAGTATAGAATPNLHMSNGAARLVLQGILAQNRLTQAAPLLYQKTAPGADYLPWKAQFNTQQDPRAYTVDLQTPAEKQATVKSLGGVGSPAYANYKQSYLSALAAGVVPNASP